LDIARFATPDLGISKSGNYVSLFAPTLSFIVLPGYLLGKLFGLAQVGTFAVISLFALLNALLIRAISIRLGLSHIAGTVAGTVFLFATPAFAYGVTLYQHHLTVFMILSSIFALMNWKGLKPLLYVWFICALSISLDNPNLVILFPIGLYALTRVIYFEKKDGHISVWHIKPLGIASLLIMLIPMAFFFWYNFEANGNPFQISGNLPAVKAIDSQGKPLNPTDADAIEYDEQGNIKVGDKNLIGAFDTRNLLGGFETHFIGLDRGMVWFTPIMLFGFIGLAFLYNSNRTYANLLITVMAADILIYSLWGDPWGGWAFGSRYLIPTYAVLSIGIAKLLDRFQTKYWLLIILILVSGYSVWVNTMGALTSNANPPQVEILGLEEITGIEQKYTYERNWDILDNNQSKSFAFQTFFNQFLTAKQYHNIIVYLINGALILLIGWLGFKEHVNNMIKRFIPKF
jgi:hypothetical protein